MTTSSPHRLGILDAIKALASTLIVLHHLAFYGPMADQLDPLLPGLMEWLREHARIAVQAFLVVGGFLAARSLSPKNGTRIRRPLALLLRRYLKLAPPFVFAMAIAVLASAVAREWMTHDSISAPSSLLQFIAHALLLQDVLGFEALSAGAWYAAIDFQLYALLLALLWLAGRISGNGRPAVVVVAAAVAVSLWHVNLDASWDIWAPYFFGSYGLGILAWRACAAQRRPAALLLTGLIVVLAGVALLLEFRPRIAVAGMLALMLIAATRARLPVPGADSASIAMLGRISYSVFLLHFPVCLLVNAAFTRFAAPDLALQACGVALAWMASILAGYAFHRWMETPLAAWSGKLFEAGRARHEPGTVRGATLAGRRPSGSL